MHDVVAAQESDAMPVPWARGRKGEKCRGPPVAGTEEVAPGTVVLPGAVVAVGAVEDEPQAASTRAQPTRMKHRWAGRT
jgi:hypothetical protein